MDGIKEETVGYLFNVEVQVNDGAPADEQPQDAAPAAVLPAPTLPTPTLAAPKVPLLAKGLAPSRPAHLEYSAPSESGGVVHGELAVEDAGTEELDPNASRADRRRAERARRKGGR